MSIFLCSLLSSCRHGSMINTDCFPKRALKVQACPGSTGNFLDFNSPKGPFPWFLSWHLDRILASSILLGWRLANWRIISSPDFNLEIFFKIYDIFLMNNLTNFLDPLSPNSAQNQFSPNDIHRLSWAKSMRINKMNTKRKIFDLLPNSLN